MSKTTYPNLNVSPFPHQIPSHQLTHFHHPSPPQVTSYPLTPYHLPTQTSSIHQPSTTSPHRQQPPPIHLPWSKYSPLCFLSGHDKRFTPRAAFMQCWRLAHPASWKPTGFHLRRGNRGKFPHPPPTSICYVSKPIVLLPSFVLRSNSFAHTLVYACYPVIFLRYVLHIY